MNLVLFRTHQTAIREPSAGDKSLPKPNIVNSKFHKMFELKVHFKCS